jgi:hypothetical protein
MLTVAFALTAILIVSAPGAVFAEETIPIDIEVSPHVLNTESKGGSISIHTNFPYSVPVEDTTVTVEGEDIEVLATFLDSRGALVVKCDIDDVKDSDAVVLDADNTFVLTCNYNDDVYMGTDTIYVICVIPEGL